MPFGCGPRLCPGEQMAWQEMRLMLALIFQCFEVTLAMDPADVVPIEKFVTWAENDIMLSLKPRKVEVGGGTGITG